jgi:hypothetical protein
VQDPELPSQQDDWWEIEQRRKKNGRKVERATGFETVPAPSRRFATNAFFFVSNSHDER